VHASPVRDTIAALRSVVAPNYLPYVRHTAAIGDPDVSEPVDSVVGAPGDR
jgi:hypothetical protein